MLNDWGEDDLQDLLMGLDHVIANEPIDEQRLAISGLSYGGYMTNWAITQTNRFKAAVSRNSFSSIATAALLSDQTVWFNLSMQDEELQRDRSPLTFADRITTPLLLLHSDQDLHCPFSESQQLFVALRKRKHTVELVRYHNNAPIVYAAPSNGLIALSEISVSRGILNKRLMRTCTKALLSLWPCPNSQFRWSFAGPSPLLPHCQQLNSFIASSPNKK